MHIIVAAPDEKLRDALEQSFDGLEDVSVHPGSIFHVDCDALVSPANSFGFMDGGLDAAIVRHFGSHVQDRVRERILFDHNGELPVGNAVIVETGQSVIPYVIAAPTMRVSMWLGPETINPYLATRAVLLLVREGQFPDGTAHAGAPIAEQVKRIAFPGMGTGVGGVPPEISAHQIAEAIRQHRSGQYRLPQSWAEASEDHQRLYTDKPSRLQR